MFSIRIALELAKEKSLQNPTDQRQCAYWLRNVKAIILTIKNLLEYKHISQLSFI